MIRVLFFASFRDRLGTGQIEVSPADAGPDLLSLRRFLANRGGAWAEVLGTGERVLVAINQQITSMESSVDDGDEVAFMPPVTGG